MAASEPSDWCLFMVALCLCAGRVQLLADLALLCPENQRVLEEEGAVEAVVDRFQAEIEKEDASTAAPMLQALATLSEQHEPSRQRCVDLRVLEQALQVGHLL